jgi:hypothetical protein
MMNIKFVIIICIFIVLVSLIRAAPIEKESNKMRRLPGKRISTKSPLNAEYKPVGSFNPYNVINMNAKMSHKNEERRKIELLRPTKPSSTTTTSTTVTPPCMPQVVTVDSPSKFYPVFTSKDWSPLGR